LFGAQDVDRKAVQKGECDMAQCMQVKDSTHEKKQGHELEVVCTGRTFRVRAEDARTKEAWRNILALHAGLGQQLTRLSLCCKKKRLTTRNGRKCLQPG
jgi:hypothetical protein